MLRINRRKITAAVRSGELAVHQLPGSRASRILVSALEDWVKSWPWKPRVQSKNGETDVQ
jgi:hypothetical protein